MKKRRARSPHRSRAIEQSEETPLAADISAARRGGGPRLSGGDVDADWGAAESTGEEAVGGSVATPDQDIVDEIGQALGVEQESDAEVTTSEEILRRRDRFRWHLEHDADIREREREERPAEASETAGSSKPPRATAPAAAKRPKARAPKKRRRAG